MAEKRIKPVELADRAAEEHAGRGAGRGPGVVATRPVACVTRPAEVFVALRNDDETDVDARSEPILAIVIVAGMAACC